jgi:peptidoglycan/LPS O-acetylase OafA/YrhL
MTDIPGAPAASTQEEAHAAPPPRIDSSLRIPALDGLRGIAILLVLLWHSAFRTPFLHNPTLNRLVGIGRLSWSGVDLFFVLSGFLIGGILLDHRQSPNYFKTFYLRRAYRILPLYFVVLTVCWLVYEVCLRGWTPFGHMEILPGEVPLWSFFTFTQNLAIAVTGGSSRGGLGVTWSLAIEEQFYLTLPLVIRYSNTKNLIRVLVGVICGAPILRALLIHSLSDGAEMAYVLTPCRADTLAMGVLCAVLVRTPEAWDFLNAHLSWVWGAFCSLGLGLLAMLFKEYPFYNRALYGLEFSVLAGFYAALLLLALIGKNKFVPTVLCNPHLMKLGTIAYGTYLFHYLLIDFVRFFLTHNRAQPPAIAFFGADLIGIALAIALANISWRRFEMPLVQRGHASKF